MENPIWEWNPLKGSIGEYQLNASIRNYKSIHGLKKLKKHNGEDFDTFQIPDNGFSKIMVRHNCIKAITCNEQFNYFGKNLIGLTVEEVSKHLCMVWENFQDTGIYYNAEHGITLYVIEEKVKWVSIDSWN